MAICWFCRIFKVGLEIEWVETQKTLTEGIRNPQSLELRPGPILGRHPMGGGGLGKGGGCGRESEVRGSRGLWDQVAQLSPVRNPAEGTVSGRMGTSPLALTKCHSVLVARLSREACFMAELQISPSAPSHPGGPGGWVGASPQEPSEQGVSCSVTFPVFA